MAWIDFSSTASNDWTEGPSNTIFASSVASLTDYEQSVSCAVTFTSRSPVSLTVFEPVPGQENANITAVFPVQGDLVAEGGGGGGSTRPASGFLYPRGQS